jgi:hypothetical protein
VADNAQAPPPDQVADDEVWALVGAEVSALPEQYRAPLVLCYLEGRTNDQAARELGWAPGSMSYRLARARERLQARLARRGVMLSAAGAMAVLADQVATAEVPAALSEATLRTTLLLLAGRVPSAVLSAQAAALAEGALHGLAATRLKSAAALLAVCVAATVGGVAWYRTGPSDPLPPSESPSAVGDWSLAVEQRVQQLQPTRDERRIDDIGWARDIRTAKRLAREHQRPVFLFVHEGRIGTGRCGGSAFNLRAHSLADERIIAQLNSAYVPVYAATDGFDKEGINSDAEREERQRLTQEALDKKLYAGQDCIFLLAADGTLVDTMPIRLARQPELLRARLEQIAERLQSVRGSPVVKPTPQSVPPRASGDTLILHLTARTSRRDAWCEFPAEDWLVLFPEQWARLLPAEVTAGHSWKIDSQLSALLLSHCYPQTENNELCQDRFERCQLNAEVVAVRDGTARLRLEGQVRMIHRFYPDRDYYTVDATLTGFVDVDVAARRVGALRLVTEKATYGPWRFDVAIRSVP